MNAKRPDIEFSRYDKRTGLTTHYGHLYWRPFLVHIWGRTIIGKRHLARS